MKDTEGRKEGGTAVNRKWTEGGRGGREWQKRSSRMKWQEEV